MITTCELCGAEFEFNPLHKRRRFCSKYCKDRASHLRRHPRVERQCRYCGVVIPDDIRLDATFCGDRCRDLYHYERRGPADRLRRFGMTPETFAERLAAQGGTCAIPGCEIAIDGNGRRLHVDHDHSCCPGRESCGKCIRGLLCGRHNVGLGMFADDPAMLRSAADYLETHRAMT